MKLANEEKQPQPFIREPVIKHLPVQVAGGWGGEQVPVFGLCALVSSISHAITGQQPNLQQSERPRFTTA